MAHAAIRCYTGRAARRGGGRGIFSTFEHFFWWRLNGSRTRVDIPL